MAVYTEVPAEALEQFLARYESGALLSAKGIAEGVSNSNFLIETETARYILTLYEKRIDLGELPWFIALMEHLADAGLPVPHPIRDREGAAIQQLVGKTACLIQYLPGVSVSVPTAAQARAAGAALARLHLAGASYTAERPNALGLSHWQASAAELGAGLDSIEPGLAAFVAERLETLAAHWPRNLPRGTVHADLFPDNVLMLGETVTGLIDFYFACTDLYAYDLAVLHAAWAFPKDGCAPLMDHARAIFEGYESVRPLSAAERAAFPLLGQGASLRFLLTRAQDWLAPPSDALVQRKDPLPFARRLAHYARLDG
ncbi:homoserine kinase [Sandaracinobacter neustonicus]|uniref:Homoserine kinase n=1 Tax=Sandaracinobacter neustonicus TaxID=1715348 RepID=A0A501XU40_9SPHN|nr:homoserine kinase [Sandaracinobacter neustonicus]TPE63969.1 homoserine kinase [Sandaracinobacter neustonicus]